MAINLSISFVIAAIIRCLLLSSNFAKLIQNRVEVSTPLNSWKRTQEGVYLFENGFDPYSGDVYHENPLILFASRLLINYASPFIPFVFVAIDLVSAFLLYRMAKNFIEEKFDRERRNEKHIAKGTELLQIAASDLIDIPSYVAVAYLFNPYSVFSCISQTTTVFSNLFLAGFFFFMSRRELLPCCLFLALETQRNFYPFVLIVPAALYICQYEPEEDDTFDIHERVTYRWSDIISVIVVFVATLILTHITAFCVVNKWDFLDATYGFILNHRDLKPNIGLFWYFFTEMFEHFRTLFLITFQMNATILYSVPLTIKLHKLPVFLATILTALITIFRSYPCVGDVAFYLALFPLWKQSARLMANYFVVFCIFLITTALGPTVWYLWINCNTANANFYFGATLAFACAQIFLVTDLLFAANKREFCIRNGLNRVNQLILE